MEEEGHPFHSLASHMEIWLFSQCFVPSSQLSIGRYPGRDDSLHWIKYVMRNMYQTWAHCIRMENRSTFNMNMKKEYYVAYSHFTPKSLKKTLLQRNSHHVWLATKIWLKFNLIPTMQATGTHGPKIIYVKNRDTWISRTAYITFDKTIKSFCKVC